MKKCPTIVEEDIPIEALLNPPSMNAAEEKECETHDPDLLNGISALPVITPDPSRPLSKIEQMQLKQKQMEEENKKKRALLLNVIKDRAQRTAEEAKTLTCMQNELQKIDQVVAQDVKILRQTIEVASLDFSEAQ